MTGGCSDLLSTMTGGFVRQFFPGIGKAFPSFKDKPRAKRNTDEHNGRKRKTTSSESPVGSQTPTLLAPRNRGRSDPREDASTTGTESPPSKRRRGHRMGLVAPSPNRPLNASVDPQLQSDLLRLIPEEVIGHCLGFLGSVQDRYALQTVCVQFKRISNTDTMLQDIHLGGNHETGQHGIIRESDTPVAAAARLTPFARAGNLEAIYMLGMIKSYCHQDVERGIYLLKLASARGYVRSSYALGLILRDSLREQSSQQLQLAADKGYLPALQELLSAREMKAKYGEPDAEELRRHLDPICLNRLLGRYYLQSTDLQSVNTSHCWNPLCGRWAFKATMTSSGVAVRMRPPFSFAFFTYPGGASSAVDTQPVAAPVPPPVKSPTQSSECSDGGEANANFLDLRVSRMKMCSRCCRAKYCSKLCQVYDWRSGRHKMECQFL